MKKRMLTKLLKIKFNKSTTTMDGVLLDGNIARLRVMAKWLQHVNPFLKVDFKSKIHIYSGTLIILTN